MPFNEKRARAFAEYTVTALLEEKPGKIIVASRSDVAAVLKVKNLWDIHIDVMRATVEKHDVGIANLGSRIAFMRVDRNCVAFNMLEARRMTDKFEKVYGSEAADEMWDQGTYKAA